MPKLVTIMNFAWSLSSSHLPTFIGFHINQNMRFKDIMKFIGSSLQAQSCFSLSHSYPLRCGTRCSLILYSLHIYSTFAIHTPASHDLRHPISIFWPPGVQVPLPPGLGVPADLLFLRAGEWYCWTFIILFMIKILPPSLHLSFHLVQFPLSFDLPSFSLPGSDPNFVLPWRHQGDAEVQCWGDPAKNCESYQEDHLRLQQININCPWDTQNHALQSNIYLIQY